MSDSPKADDARDDYILQERLGGRSARSIGKELHCPVSEIDDRALSHRSPARTSLVGKCCMLLSR
jgi:hypothetical protein